MLKKQLKKTLFPKLKTSYVVALLCGVNFPLKTITKIEIYASEIKPSPESAINKEQIKFEPNSFEDLLEKETNPKYNKLIHFFSNEAKKAKDNSTQISETSLKEAISSLKVTKHLEKSLSKENIPANRRLGMLEGITNCDQQKDELQTLRKHLRKSTVEEIQISDSKVEVLDREIRSYLKKIEKSLKYFLQSYGQDPKSFCEDLKFEICLDQFLIANVFFEKKIDTEYQNFLKRLKNLNTEHTDQALLSHIAYHLTEINPHNEDKELAFILTKKKEVFYLFVPKEKVSFDIFSPVYILLKQAFKQISISSSSVDKVVSSYNLSLVDQETFNVTLGKKKQTLVKVKKRHYPGLEDTMENLNFSKLNWQESSHFSDIPHCFKQESQKPAGVQNLRNQPYKLKWYLATAQYIAKNIHPNLLGIKNGHAVVALLVLNDGTIENIGINTSGGSNCKHKHLTGHAEINLVEAYFSKYPDRQHLPRNSTIITTLKPCSMCAAFLASVKNPQTKGPFVYYEQNDPTQSMTILTEECNECSTVSIPALSLKVKEDTKSKPELLSLKLEAISQEIKETQGLNSAASTRSKECQKIRGKIIFEMKRQYRKNGPEHPLSHIFLSIQDFLLGLHIDLNLPK